jgi:CheY-like chemotaxis protein
MLVVDDLKDSADSLAMFLRMLGHEVRTAYDGLEAVAAAEGFRPEVVLLDIGMPRLNGLEACRRIRERSWGGEVFIVALTGWGQDDDRRRTSQAGFDAHIVKPVDPQVLMKLVSTPPPKAAGQEPQQAP